MTTTVQQIRFHDRDWILAESAIATVDAFIAGREIPSAE